MISARQEKPVDHTESELRIVYAYITILRRGIET